MLEEKCNLPELIIPEDIYDLDTITLKEKIDLIKVKLPGIL